MSKPGAPCKLALCFGACNRASCECVSLCLYTSGLAFGVPECIHVDWTLAPSHESVCVRVAANPSLSGTLAASHKQSLV
jgi:hypothetical protein